MTEATANTATEAKIELTLEQKLEQAEARVRKLRQQILTANLLNNIQIGDDVTIKYGRGDKVRNVEGKVVGVSLPDVVVLDSDLQSYKVNVRDILENAAAAARVAPVKNVDEIDPVTGKRPEEAGGTDAVDPEIERFENEGGAAVDPLEQA